MFEAIGCFLTDIDCFTCLAVLRLCLIRSSRLSLLGTGFIVDTHPYFVVSVTGFGVSYLRRRDQACYIFVVRGLTW